MCVDFQCAQISHASRWTRPNSRVEIECTSSLQSILPLAKDFLGKLLRAEAALMMGFDQLAHAAEIVTVGAVQCVCRDYLLYYRESGCIHEDSFGH